MQFISVALCYNQIYILMYGYTIFEYLSREHITLCFFGDSETDQVVMTVFGIIETLYPSVTHLTSDKGTLYIQQDIADTLHHIYKGEI